MTAPAAAPTSDDDPETVVVTYQVKYGEEAALIKVLAAHWKVARQLNLVLASPHLLLQGRDQGREYLMEIFTWRDSSIPDNAPDTITQLWQEMNQHVEARGGHPGIDFSHVHMLTP
jgi:hypothetical protein